MQHFSFRGFISTSNSMDSSEIWDKYHECCIENGYNFNATRVVFIPNFSAILMLFPVNIPYWCILIIC